jgi:hypothetical protein
MSASRASCLSFLFAFALPVFSLAIGWIGWDFRVGVIAAIITFMAFLILGGTALAFVRDLSWFSVALPFLASVAYVVLPDLLPFLPFDDAAAVAAGSLGSFALAIRKEPSLPRWLVVPLLASAIYTLFGAVIPGPVDELLVLLIGAGASALGAARSIQINASAHPNHIIDQQAALPPPSQPGELDTNHTPR